ncbi:MAG: GNAT family N-acetyltransferase [Bacteroidetes bacterium]|nr:GNAT family N-acetyltransferase [Bacteroidota bacterium]
MQPTELSGYAAEVFERHRIDDAIWDGFIARSPQGAPYGLSWYLDVVWPGWQGIAVFHNGKMLAVMPLRISRKYWVSYLFTPRFCQYTGIFFGEVEKKNATQTLALKKRLVSTILDHIPKEVKVLNLNFAPEFDYPLPFHWAGWELHVRYSYWLDNQEDKEQIFRNFDERTRTYINKARKSGLAVSQVQDVDDIIRLAGERKAYPLDSSLLRSLWQAFREQKTGTALEVRDGQGRLHAGLIYQRFGHKIIHLFSAFDPEVGQLGGMSLAIWTSIEQAGPEVRAIDFEGSMLEPVENFFRGFGTRPVAYLQIRKNTFPKPLRWLLGK